VGFFLAFSRLKGVGVFSPSGKADGKRMDTGYTCSRNFMAAMALEASNGSVLHPKIS